ncbi:MULTISPECIES: DUF2243 domain-containing protein [unclassified Streptomyces]|uniref:DUF2243 domain-containing protein n=1 Tax=Streptomyces TaxID=1883 RepID=UPI0001C1A302|nr:MULTISPECIES: DUF2243 domain-containing protein [unclassified Streptomyces]AEN08275.1 Protein of unknown function DUF2243, membrane [Streptomyces sp. SirexAA-E]MYR68225.1 DUF2243 domain-containing protein [Streptomyces sp. SID4939]MYS02564.1 DUF2243 domain-containing protein [Streptomyces sp. SID4940]MYT66580.1 DUF2243 domain-containing protein [Streptomyces sp. SID8357]MYT83501.1 DUF2243 domain-containing protein [Streptomyces sp. SID8360]
MATSTDGVRGIAAPRSIRLPGIVLGVGLGGFVDGILLHQLLQWHHMLSSTNDDRIGVKYYSPNTVSGLEMNTVWDGIFHAVCWMAVLLGLGILYARVTHHRRRVWTSRVLWGWILAGWGLFNLVEGLLDHQILGIHHVYAGDQQIWWDMGFLLLGLLFLIGGYLLQRGGRPLAPDTAGPRGERP